MVVIAAIIGGKGLGDPVRAGLNNLQPGLAFVGGIGIVLLAIILDRITQAMAQPTGHQRQSVIANWLKMLFLPRRLDQSHSIPRNGPG